LKPDLIGSIRDTRKCRIYRFRDQAYIFLVCLLISLFLWILVRLSKNYYPTVSYELRYTGIPAGFRLNSASDKTLTLKIKVQGYDFFTDEYIKNRQKYFDVSLKGIRVKPAGDHKARGYVLSSRIAGEIASRTSHPLEIISIEPDTLFFTFDKTGSLRTGTGKKD